MSITLDAPVFDKRASDMAFDLLAGGALDNATISLPVRIEEISEGLGVETFDASLPDQVACMIAKREGQSARILLNEDDHWRARRYAWAFGLGYYLAMGGEKAGTIAFQATEPLMTTYRQRGDDMPVMGGAEERYAHEFARALLMPASAVWQFRDHSDAELARIFGVEVQTIKARRDEIGIGANSW